MIDIRYKYLLIRFVCLILFVFLVTETVSAGIELTGLFSDFTSSDITVISDKDFNGSLIFSLIYSGEIVESHKIQVNVRAKEPLTKVIIWQKIPQHDFYSVNVSLYEGDRLLSSSISQIAYGTVTLPSFQVVDFSPSKRGVLLLLRSYNPTVTDIKIELLDNNDIIYSKTEDDISLTASTVLEFDWPFLLTDNKNYTVRTKIFSHRLNAPPLVNTYVDGFIADDDVEILSEDVQVDEYGASVTIRGKSQVPFDGYIFVTAKNRQTGKMQNYSQLVEDILTSGKESTAGIVWKGIDPGIYDIIIEAVNSKNTTLDKYETVLRIPEYPVTNLTTPPEGTPGFEVIFFFISLVFSFLKRKGVRCSI